VFTRLRRSLIDKAHGLNFSSACVNSARSDGVLYGMNARAFIGTPYGHDKTTCRYIPMHIEPAGTDDDMCSDIYRGIPRDLFVSAVRLSANL